MALERYTLTFNSAMADKPIVCSLGKKFDVDTIIEKASVSPEAGWIQLAIKGEPEEIQRAVADLNTRGVFVSPVELAVFG